MQNEEELLSSCKKKLVKELPALRKICNLTQEDLGKIVGVTRQTIVNIENCKCEMKSTLFLTLIFLISLNKNCMNYIKETNIPYKELKEVLANKFKKDAKPQAK